MQINLTKSQLQTIAQQVIVTASVVMIGGLVLQNILSVVWLLLGGLVGVVLWWLDELVGLAYYRRNEQDTELITRSPLFAMVFAVVALFVVTSTDQHIGFGVIWGLSAGMLVEVWSLVTRPEMFVNRFLSMISRDTKLVLTQIQTTQIAVGFTAFELVLLCLWVLRLT